MKRTSSKISSLRSSVSRAEAYIIGVGSISSILENVRSAFPREASGMLLGEGSAGATILSICPTRCDENTPVSFRIRDETIRNIEESLRGVDVRIRGCFHSHILGAARPSKYDRAGSKAAGDLWLIFSVRFNELRLFEWDGNAFQRKCFRISSSTRKPYESMGST